MKIRIISLFLIILCTISLVSCEEFIKNTTDSISHNDTTTNKENNTTVKYEYIDGCFPDPAVPTEYLENGLALFLNEDGKSYSVAIGNFEGEELVIPSHHDGLPIVTIQECGFINNKSLKSVTLPETIIVIGFCAFSNCDSLQDLNIPNSVKEIHCTAIASCPLLKEIYIPASVEYIHENAFDSNLNLVSFNVDTENQYYKSIDGNLYTKNGDTLIQYATGKTEKSFAVPQGVTLISGRAFADCIYLEDIYIPESVVEIGQGAFRECHGLTNVTFAEKSKLEIINGSTFFGCVSLEYIYLPDSVKELWSGVFWGCSSLKEINMGENVKYFGQHLLHQCYALEKIVFRGSMSQWNRIEKDQLWQTHANQNYILECLKK